MLGSDYLLIALLLGFSLGYLIGYIVAIFVENYFSNNPPAFMWPSIAVFDEKEKDGKY